jgi:hypothetical protein
LFTPLSYLTLCMIVKTFFEGTWTKNHLADFGLQFLQARHTPRRPQRSAWQWGTVTGFSRGCRAGPPERLAWALVGRFKRELRKGGPPHQFRAIL